MDNYYDYYEEDEFGERKKNNKKKKNNKANYYEEQYLNAKDEYGATDENMGKDNFNPLGLTLAGKIFVTPLRVKRPQKWSLGESALLGDWFFIDLQI